jgi:hypothetical protein
VGCVVCVGVFIDIQPLLLGLKPNHLKHSSIFLQDPLHLGKYLFHKLAYRLEHLQCCQQCAKPIIVCDLVSNKKPEKSRKAHPEKAPPKKLTPES